MANEDSKYELVSRKDAKERGLQFYFTGRPCKHGHLSLRYTNMAACRECMVVRRRQWATDNKERLAELNRQSKHRTRDERNARYRASYAENPQKYIAKTKRYYAKNSEQIRRKRREWHHANYATDEQLRKGAQERVRQWAVDNPDKALLQRKVGKQKRRARERGAIGGFSNDDLAALFEHQKGKCVYCSRKLKPKYHADHIVPLSRGGTNNISNIQLLCQPCNLAKAARDPIVHAQSLGRLL